MTTTMTARPTARRDAIVRPVPRRRKLPGPARKAVLLAHVILSMGWLGMSATTFVMSVVAFSETRPAVLRGIFEFQEVLSAALGRPMAVGSLVTGLVLSFGTKWGVFRYYWVAVKFVLLILMVAAAIILLPPWIADGIANSGRPGSAGSTGAIWGITLVSAFHVTGLVVSSALSVYKPPRRVRGVRAVPEVRRSAA